MTILERLPFARMEFHYRQRKAADGETCAWCGQRKVRRCGTPYLLEFWIEHDSGGVESIPKRFCTISCYRSFTT